MLAGDLPLLGGDRVAGRLDPVVGRLQLVDQGGDLIAQAADPGDHLVVVALDVVQVLGARQQVRPVGGAHDHGGHVGVVRLVDVDEQLLERADRRLQLRPDPRQLGLLGIELGGRLLELGLLRRQLVLCRRLLLAQLGLPPISWSTRAFMLSICERSGPSVDWIRLSSLCFCAIFEAGSPIALWPRTEPITRVTSTISASTAARPRGVDGLCVYSVESA